MPTGYTADVQSGKVTSFREFAIKCARAFGACILMRDDPQDAVIPEKFDPSDHHQKALASAQKRLTALLASSPEDVAAAYEDYYLKKCDYNAKELAEAKLHRERYEAMLARVREWTPPTVDHAGVKKFMIEQLENSIKWDCTNHDEYYAPPKRVEPMEWHAQEIEDERRNIEYHTREHAGEVERAEQRTKWIQDLRESLAVS